MCSTSTVLTDNDFTHSNVTYQIEAITFARSLVSDPWAFRFTFNKVIPADIKTWTLDFGSRQVSLASPPATYSNSDKTVTWSVESSYTLPQTLSMKLKTPDTTAPTVSSAAVNGTALTITYNENLDTNSVPAPGQFTVTVDGSGQTPTGVAINGKTVTLTLGTAVATGQTVTVAYNAPTNNPIQDASGNDAGALSNQQVTNNTPDPSAAPPPPPPPPPPVIESPEGVSHSGNASDGFSLTPLGEGGSIVYRKRTIDIPVTRDECTSPGNPALIISRSTLDRVREITFELSETSPQDPPSGFRMEGCVAEIDPGIRLGQRETVAVCLPTAEVNGKSYVHRYDEEWKILPSRSETVNGEKVVCGDTDSFSMFGVFLPVIESAEGVNHSEDPEYGFSLTPLGEGGSIVYGERTIDLSVTGDVGSSGDPAVIVSRSVLDRVEEITFELSEVSPHDPPPGFYLEGFSAEVDLGVTLEPGETVSVCLPSAGESDIYRYSEVLGEWEVLESRSETVNGEEVVCGDVGAVSLTGVFVEDTGGCVIASAGGEGVPWRGAVFNLLLIMSVLMLVPGKHRPGAYYRKASG